MVKRRILFACTENSCRSQLAEAFARMADRLDLEIYSAGSSPSGAVHPRVIAYLLSRGYDPSGHRSKSLTEVPPGPYDWVITFLCGEECPQVQAHHREDWPIPDPKNLPEPEFLQICSTIEQKVAHLLSKLPSTP
ncbi:MAG: arsenate reductase ArsC [Gemmataceae bacterium]